MPTLQPQKLNFYGRSNVAQAVGQLANNIIGNPVPTNNTINSTRGSARSFSPGTQSAAGINRGQNTKASPSLNLQGLLNSAAAGAASSLVNNIMGAPDTTYYVPNGYNPYSVNPSASRLSSNGMPAGGAYVVDDFNGGLPINNFSPAVAFSDVVEDRVIISDQTNLFIGNQSNKNFNLLRTTGGVLFPLTPTITVGHKANYEMESLLQTNYATPYYTSSTVDSINIQGRFTAQTDIEGQYVLAMIQFFRTVTKMFYGASQNRGTPPPILYLDAHGQYMFDHIPVVISDFSYTLPNDVNYITANLDEKHPSKVPTDLSITLNLIPTYSRNMISNKFDLVKFSNGGLLTDTYKPGTSKPGGWL